MAEVLHVFMQFCWKHYFFRLHKTYHMAFGFAKDWGACGILKMRVMNSLYPCCQARLNMRPTSQLNRQILPLYSWHVALVAVLIWRLMQIYSMALQNLIAQLSNAKRAMVMLRSHNMACTLAGRRPRLSWDQFRITVFIWNSLMILDQVEERTHYIRLDVKKSTSTWSACRINANSTMFYVGEMNMRL